MSAPTISQDDVAAASSPSPAASVESPAPLHDGEAASNAEEADGAPLADTPTASPFVLTANERHGLLMVLGVALFQEVNSNVFRGVLAGAAAAGLLYRQRSCTTCS